MSNLYMRKLALGLSFSVLLVGTIQNAYTTEPTKQTAKSATKKPHQEELAEALRLNAAKDYRGAYATAAPLAEKGNSAAMYLLSELLAVYDNAQNISPDWDKAFDWLQRAAEKNYPPAMTKLGDVLIEESIARIYKTAPDINRGVKMIVEAEKLGDIEAMDRLGRIYSDGKGVPVDMKEALRWYEKYERATGKKSKNKAFLIEEEMNSRIGRDVCMGDSYGKSPKMQITLNSGRKIELVVAGTIVARSDSYSKVAVRINSITATDEMGATMRLQGFQFPHETITVGQENWEYTIGLVPCF